MLFEGVNFISKVCGQMSKDEFVENHIESVWLDREREDRRKMLSDAYDLIRN